MISIVRWDQTLQQEFIEDYECDAGNLSSRLFEWSRIKVLADERESVQKKTFQKWVNSHLALVNSRISDLYSDMRDGKNLIKLLEVVSGERLPRPTKGKMRIHCLENVDKALQFLREHQVHLENVGTHDIVDGNPRLSLGLIWTIILRFQIEDITIEETDNQDAKRDSWMERQRIFEKKKFQVNVMDKKNQSLRTERPRINTLCNNGQQLTGEDAADFGSLAWQELKHAIEKRRASLVHNERAQQYLSDANEAESWMSALYTMVEERGKDDISASNIMTKHESLERAAEDCADTIRPLGETVRALAAEGHPLAEQVAVKQSQLEKPFAGLKHLAGERCGKLKEELKLCLLHREVQELEQWIADRELVAASYEVGQDYNHVTLLWERFKQFARDTEAIGRERVAAVTKTADRFIECGNSDSPRTAELKNGVNELWQDLLELIDTRTQMLAASRELHKFFHDCNGLLGRILENQVSMSDECCRDFASVLALQRKHQNFMQDLQTLQSQVQQIQEESAKLQANYTKVKEITNREREVLAAWATLQAVSDQRREKLNDSGDLFKFFNLASTLMQWMDDVIRQMNSSEKLRDVSSVELLINDHSSLKAEIDAREDNFMTCIALGRELLGRNHYASAEIKDKLDTLHKRRKSVLQRCEERWEHLQLVLEVSQFDHDAAAAEARLIAQRPYLNSNELGNSMDDVKNLITKHEAEARFSALEQITTFEMREMKRREESAEAQELARREQEEPKQAEAMDAGISVEEKERSSGPGDFKSFEGVLTRKHEWKSTTVKATNRSWDKVYAVLKGMQLSFYKDSKAARSSQQTFNNETPLNLHKATAFVAHDYMKKQHVFRLKLLNGSEFLFQARNDLKMNTWIRRINAEAETDRHF